MVILCHSVIVCAFYYMYLLSNSARLRIYNSTHIKYCLQSKTYGVNKTIIVFIVYVTNTHVVLKTNHSQPRQHTLSPEVLHLII